MLVQNFFSDDESIRVQLLPNISAQDCRQHSFPVNTPKGNILPSVKAQLEKDFENKQLNQNITIKRRIKSFYLEL